MTKTENRAAAKAYRQEVDRKRAAEWHALQVAEDLEQLRILQDYLIFKRKAHIPRDALTSAIDDYVEKLTGDRTKLHAQPHSLCQGYRTPPK
jgi:hypothetical protein